MPSNTQPSLVRHGRLARKSPWLAVAKFAVAAIAVVAVSSAAVGAVAVYELSSQVTSGGVKLIGQPVAKAPPGLGAYDGEINVLIAASDGGGGDVATYGKRNATLNDVTMLLHVSADHRSATVVSFPRDLIVPIASCPNPKGGNFPAQVNKINATLEYGGLPCIVKTVENLTGMTIPFAALAEFQGVVGMSNAVGGVTVCIAQAIHDEQIHVDLEAGQQTLAGYDAVQFLRSRYGVYGGTDIARISNQQLFLSALVRKIKTPEVLGNPVKDYQLAQAIIDNTKRSESLSNLTTMVSMALAVKDISFDDVVFVQYPGGFGSAAGQNGVLPNTQAAGILFSALKNDQPIALTGGTGAGTSVDPNAPPAAPPVAPSSATPTDAATAPPSVALPESVTGQTAAQQTCTKGQRAKG